MERIILKKKKAIGIIIGLIIVLIFAYNPVKNKINSRILNDLNGEIYYTKRVDGVLTLFKSMANLENEKLLYSHKGKGKDNYGGYNDNIPDFFYDKESGGINFIAMNNGKWSLFYIKEGEKEASLIKEVELEEKYLDLMVNTDYINNNIEGVTAIEKKGSIYMIEDGIEKDLKKFYGIYDDKFTGYSSRGFSPDGRYLVYHSMDHLTPIGTIVDGLINGTAGNTYIMEIETGKDTKFIDASKIQWIMQ